MAYKKYFYKFGKRFGPYYYHSFRDKNGNVGKRYIGKKNPDLNKIILRVLIALIITVIIFLSIVIYHSYANKDKISFSSSLSSEKPENKTIWIIIIGVLIALILVILFSLMNHMLKIMFSKSIIDKKK